MDTASLYHGLTFLAWTSVVFLIIVGLFLVKVLFDISRLLQSMIQTASLIKKSAEPIMSDLSESVNIITNMLRKTEKHIINFKNISNKATKVLKTTLSKTTALSGLFIKGIWTVIKTFIKK